MKFRLSSLLYLVAVVALFLINFVQWRYIETLEAQLQAEQKIATKMKQELIATTQQLAGFQLAAPTQPAPARNAGN